jgi:hypothetical protein
MKAIIATNKGLKIEGKLCMVGDYIVTLDVDKQAIDSQVLTNMYNEGISASEYSNEWHITIARKKVESIEFVD